MNFIKLDGRYVNMANIWYIQDYPNGTLELSIVDENEITVSGQEAEALRWWLNRNSVDVLGQYQIEVEKAEVGF